MNKDELREWFYEKLFNCYKVKHKTDPDIKYLVYDKQFIRDCKLSSVLGGDVTFPTEHTGDVLFEQDLKNKIIYCDFNKIWSFFKSNYQNNYNEIRELITGFLGEIDTYKEYTSINWRRCSSIFLGEIDNCKEYTSQMRSSLWHTFQEDLGEIDKYSPHSMHNYQRTI